MPTYQYSCTECGHFFEQFQSFSDDALTECPVCGGRLRKVFNAVGVVFKGSGFYRNDSREKAGSSGGPDSAGSGDSNGSSSKDSGSDSGSSSSKDSGGKSSGAGKDSGSGKDPGSKSSGSSSTTSTSGSSSSST